MLKYDAWIKKNDENGPSSEDRAAISAKIQKGFSTLKRAHDSNELGYLKLPKRSISELLAYCDAVPDTIKNILVLGIGGSSLGPRAVHEAWLGESKRRLYFSENVDPESFQRVVNGLLPSETIVCVTTKSGSTIETMSKFWHLFHHYKSELGESAKDHFIAITDPNKGPLRSIVDTLGIQSFEVPAEIGGRFSVLCDVGLVPLALIGFPIDRFLSGAQLVVDAVDRIGEGNQDSALFRAIFDHYWAYKQGFDVTVMMPYVDALAGFSEWFCQLWGESLAKDTDLSGAPTDVSLTPLRALGTVDQHSQLQLYISGRKTKHIVMIETTQKMGLSVPDEDGLPASLAHLRATSFSDILEAEARGTQAAFEKAGVPTSRWVLAENNPESVGGLMMIYMVITSVMGDLLNINPYDQPGVEFGKRVAHGLLGKAECLDEAQIALQLIPDFSDL